MTRASSGMKQEIGKADHTWPEVSGVAGRGSLGFYPMCHQEPDMKGE